MGLTIILLGAGGFGRTRRRGIAELPDARVVAVVDAKEDAGEEAAAHYGLTIDRGLTPDSPWEHIPADLVIDAMPHPYHLENARRAYPTATSSQNPWRILGPPVSRWSR